MLDAFCKIHKFEPSIDIKLHSFTGTPPTVNKILNKSPCFWIIVMQFFQVACQFSNFHVPHSDGKPAKLIIMQPGNDLSNTCTSLHLIL